MCEGPIVQVGRMEAFTIQESDFERLVNEVYGVDYDFREDQCGDLEGDQVYWDVGERPDDFDQDRMDAFLRGWDAEDIAAPLLHNLCRRGIIRPGNYVILLG